MTNLQETAHSLAVAWVSLGLTVTHHVKPSCTGMTASSHAGVKTTRRCVTL